MFRKGEVFNSLRDIIPAFTGRMFNRRELNTADRREFWALQDLSFEVKRGEAFGIIGRNGAGKSTTLKILSRIMKPTKGKILVNGRLAALIEVTAGFHQDLTGLENIFLYGTILGMNKREIKSKLDQIIAFSGLEDFIDTPVKRYSSGMFARLGFSVAAHLNPDVLIVDETLSVGDYVFQQKCIQRMKEVVRNGTSVIFVSHNLKSVAEFCQNGLLLERGRSVAQGRVDEVIADYLRRRSAGPESNQSSPVKITKVTVRDREGECVRFESGQKAWVDIELHAQKPCRKLSVSLYLADTQGQLIFNTSSARLGYPDFDLNPGQAFRCTFELQLNLAVGTFHVGTLIFRYDNETEYDRWLQAATIFVSSAQDIRGLVNCFPKIVNQQVAGGQLMAEAKIESHAQ